MCFTHPPRVPDPDPVRNNNDARPTLSTQVINISATLHYGATWWQCHASAAKSAVDSLTRTLALEWGGGGGGTDGGGIGSGDAVGRDRRRGTKKRKRRIRVVGIAPGPIADTPGTAKLAPRVGDDGSGVSDHLERRIPLGRMGEAYEIGHAAVFLATAKYVTGHVLVVDGGEWLYRDPMIPREMVEELSRRVESKSRSLGPNTGHSAAKTAAATTTLRSKL